MTILVMRTLSTIHRKTLTDRCRNEDLQQINNIQDIRRFPRDRRNWKKQIERMAEDRLTTQAKNGQQDIKAKCFPFKHWKECWTSEETKALKLQERRRRRSYLFFS